MRDIRNISHKLRSFIYVQIDFEERRTTYHQKLNQKFVNGFRTGFNLKELFVIKGNRLYELKADLKKLRIQRKETKNDKYSNSTMYVK